MSRFTFLLTALLLLAGAAVAEEPSAAKLFADGKALLGNGDLEGAYRTFVAAVKADPENREIAQEALVLRRVVALRAHVAKAEPSPAWERQITALHHWYLEKGLVDAAIESDRAAHARSKGATTATLLGDALLRANRNAEAEAVLAEMPADRLAQLPRLFLAVAQARQGKKDAARENLERVEVDATAVPAVHMALARLHVLLGSVDEGIGHLRTLLETVPPRGHVTVRAEVKRCPDFDGVRTTKAFVAVLATKSKCAESDCSSGSDCGSCPSRRPSGGG